MKIFKPNKFFSYALILILTIVNFFATPSHGEARDKKPEPEKISTPEEKVEPEKNSAEATTDES